MDAVITYKDRRELSKDKLLAQKLKKFDKRLIIDANGELIRKSFYAPLLKCVGKPMQITFLREIHLGICGNHIGGEPWLTRHFGMDFGDSREGNMPLVRF